MQKDYKQMCGVAGFFNLYTNDFVVDPLLLEAMQSALAHRGPDGYRTWFDQQHAIGLAHRRLSIMDLSEAGFQPMIDQDKTLVVLCNGEIYNHFELKAHLQASGYVYTSGSDTETIVYAYKKWGIKSLERLQGMFSIVIYDIAKKELFLIRDRVGIKPLYFSLQGGILSFASEIKALWCLPWMSKQKNIRGIYHYLTYMACPAPLTIYKDIYKLPAAYYMKVDAAKNVTFEEWYEPPLLLSDKDEVEIIADLDQLVHKSMLHHTMADVEYGALLSGGIDSSLNVALIADKKESLKTFSVSFADGPEYNELQWARKVARHFSTDHHEIIISQKEAFDFYESMLYYQDEPLADCVCIPLYYVCKLAQQNGISVVHVGEGSDELFCGYPLYVDYMSLYNRYWSLSQEYIPAFAKKTLASLASPLLEQRPTKQVLLQRWLLNQHPFWSGAVAFSEHTKDIFFNEQRVEYDEVLQKIYPGFDQSLNSYALVDYHLKQIKQRAPEADFLTTMIYLELKQRLPELLLMRVDKMSMANGIEARVPFLDHQLLEYALSIPSSLKYKDGQTKYILKKVAKNYLPHEIVYRKKMGFAAPINHWFKQGSQFSNYFQHLLIRKESDWNEVFDFNNLTKFFNTTQQQSTPHALELWVVQNLISMNL